MLYHEIFNKRIDNNEKVKSIKETKEDILDAYSKSKLIELHYDLLKEKISKIEKKNKNDKNENDNK